MSINPPGTYELEAQEASNLFRYRLRCPKCREFWRLKLAFGGHELITMKLTAPCPNCQRKTTYVASAQV